jgi:dGTPase
VSGYDESSLERYVIEPPKATTTARPPFGRDRARVLHSAAFRRLAGKTQVVGAGVADFPRTRLTHSLECAQIGRELALQLGADADLVDAACLAHDLGHPPFGHNGETALDVAAATCGGFEGNAQSLRVITRLEAKTVAADGRSAGLNLTRGALDAATKYPWTRGESTTGKYGAYDDDLPVFDWLRDGAPRSARCLEAQIMDWSDDVAYSVHDFEDGVQAGLVPVDRLGDDDAETAVVTTAAAHYSAEPPDVLAEAFARLRRQPWWLQSFDDAHTDHVRLKRTTSELTARLCAAAVAATRGTWGDGPLTRYGAELVVPDDTRAECAVLKAVTHHYVMQRPGAAELQHAERALMAELVAAVAAGAPDTLARDLRSAYAEAATPGARLRVVIDQVAGLTDISARAWHLRLCGQPT